MVAVGLSQDLQMKKITDPTSSNVCMTMCCMKEVLDSLFKVYSRSAAIIQRDSVMRNANLIRKRN